MSNLVKRNNSIDLMRIICAVLAVFCHADIFIDINSNLYNIVNRYFLRFVVAYFLIVSGYFYIKSLLDKNMNFKKWFFSIFKTYLFWSMIYYAISFVTTVIIDKEPIGTFITQRIAYFFLDGSFYHFWYFLALMYSILAVTLFYKLFGEKGIIVFAIIAIFLNIAGALGTTYSFIGAQIPIFSDLIVLPKFEALVLIMSIGFSSFSAGYFIHIIKKKQLIKKPQTNLIMLSIILAIYIAEIIFLVVIMKSTDSPLVPLTAYPLVICMLLTFLDYPMSKYVAGAKFSRRVSGFIYYIHPLILLAIEMMLGYLGIALGSIPYAFISVSAVLILAVIVSRWDNKFTRLLLGVGGNKK